MSGLGKGIVFFGIVFSLALRAATIVQPDFGPCHELPIKKELTVYKDPTWFLSQMNRLRLDPQRTLKDLRTESPVIRELEPGRVMVRLSTPQIYKRYDEVLLPLYEWLDPELGRAARNLSPDGSVSIRHIQLCKNGESGVVLVPELEDAKQPKVEAGAKAPMQPSTLGNEIPKWSPKD